MTSATNRVFTPTRGRPGLASNILTLGRLWLRRLRGPIIAPELSAARLLDTRSEVQLLRTAMEPRLLDVRSEVQLLRTAMEPRLLDVRSDVRLLGTAVDPRLVDTARQARLEVTP